MKTVWGEALDKNKVLQEYPRPMLVRESYINLNGVWKYAITDKGENPDAFDGEIVVPFSPECELSGVKRSVGPADTLWYERSFCLEKKKQSDRVLLNFGAVDQAATVYVNGKEAGSHTGGYTAFTLDITSLAKAENTLTVKVTDSSDTSYHSRGKQKTERGGIWYTPQSGIWQTVWLECVPCDYIKALKTTPLFDESAVELTVNANTKGMCVFSMGGKEVYFDSDTSVRIPVENMTPWTPENPFLYSFFVTFGEDKIESYFGMRKFSVKPDSSGCKRLFLNNEPYFHTGLLDQGYYSDGMYTPPSDEAMIFDIETAKKAGFNMLRKHIKIDTMRWYYHCDRLGMLVWQDMVNGGGDYSFFTISSPLVTGIHFNDTNYKRFARQSAEGRAQYIRELLETIEQLYNCVSLAMWVPFNEGWGQFDSKKVVKKIVSLDATRTIDHASGWHDQKIGDIKSLHVYFKKYRFKKDKLKRAVILSEFGGFSYREKNDDSFNERDFGYRKFNSGEELVQAWERLYREQIIPAAKKGLSAAVYTQLSDVEEELNGLVTYDRRTVKLDCERLRKINEELKIAGR
ncbi:MAG: glycoside hydrolase family 2 TIM barrel-domain containing protein [Oscillospiraceae bacterium]